ncbi:MAG TPA: M23 family metallopeptidase [Bryobacteraceae bacterium]|nr:M23 family metallopeptidase [Bryobacteraceae bacterium]
MHQQYFILDFAHSFHGRLKRVHIPYQALYVTLVLGMFGAVSLFGFVSSYVRMSMKVAGVNQLRQEIEILRDRYQSLEHESETKDQQLASLQLLAHEVSAAYGLERQPAAARKPQGASLMPTVTETLEQYNFLKSANYVTARRSRELFPSETLPSLWPVDGRLMSSFGHRSDPFSGGEAFHAGVDISAGQGTPIKAAADGVIVKSEWAGEYGRLVVIDHGGGLQTYYAHMSRTDVIAGQWVRRGELVGRVGSTGRSTSSHLHYEVRRNGTPINPYPYLKNTYAAVPTVDFRL